MDNSSKLCISLEGQIGSGKSTLLENIRPYVPVPIFQENVDEWRFLPLYYSNPKDYSYLLQLEILFDLKQLSKYSQVISERSAKTSIEVFSRLNLARNFISKNQFQILQQIEQEILMQPTHYIYLSVPPELAFQRIQARNRLAEKEINLEYLEVVESYYQEFLENVSNPVFVIDGSKSEEEIQTTFLDYYEQIKKNSKSS